MIKRAADLKVATAATQLSRLSIDVTHKASFLKCVMTLVRKVPKYWIAASTHIDEEKFCLNTHLSLKRQHKDIITIIVPRHIDRAILIQDELKKLNLNVHIHEFQKKHWAHD